MATQNKRFLVKSHVANQALTVVRKPALQRDLGLLIKSRINDAVASGRLSGTTAVAGIKALGLSQED